MSGQSVEERLAHAVERGDVQWFMSALVERTQASGTTPLTVEGLALAALDVAHQAEMTLPMVQDHARAEATCSTIAGLRALAFELVQREILDPIKERDET